MRPSKVVTLCPVLISHQVYLCRLSHGVVDVVFHMFAASLVGVYYGSVEETLLLGETYLITVWDWFSIGYGLLICVKVHWTCLVDVLHIWDIFLRSDVSFSWTSSWGRSPAGIAGGNLLVTERVLQTLRGLRANSTELKTTLSTASVANTPLLRIAIILTQDTYIYMRNIGITFVHFSLWGIVLSNFILREMCICVVVLYWSSPVQNQRVLLVFCLVHIQ